MPDAAPATKGPKAEDLEVTKEESEGEAAGKSQTFVSPSKPNGKSQDREKTTYHDVAKKQEEVEFDLIAAHEAVMFDLKNEIYEH